MLYYIKRAALTIALLIALVIGWPIFVAFTLIVATDYLWRGWERRRAVARFRRERHPQGKDLLLVYSNSPHWQRYVEEHWLPKWGDRAAVLNWSERHRWRKSRRPEVLLFKAFSGEREFNPLAVVVPPNGPVHVVRFWRAFRDFKHGKAADSRMRACPAGAAAIMDGLR